MKLTFRTAAAGLVLLSSAGLASAQEVTGAGASFPAPLYAKWAADYYKATGVKINYQSVGSGAGLVGFGPVREGGGAGKCPVRKQSGATPPTRQLEQSVCDRNSAERGAFRSAGSGGVRPRRTHGRQPFLTGP